VKKAFLQLHIAVFLAGFTAILGKLIGLNEALLVWYRLLLTVIVLALLMQYKKQHILLRRSDITKITAVGTIIAFHWLAFYGSIKYSTASIALVCLSAAGFFTAIFESLVLKRKIILIEMMLGVLCIIGLYIIFDFHPQYKTGIIFGLLSAMASALFPVLNKQLLQNFSPRVLTLYELIGGFVILTIALPVYLQLFPATYYLPTMQDWWWLLILAIVCTVLCFDLVLSALKKISAFTANLSYNLEPLYGIILAFIIFKEDKLLHGKFYLGLAFIITAISLQMIRVYWIQKVRGVQ
jgi:drug/metabolite transporter (DMT)-like permease